MGEKIRDIQEIKLAQETLVIELNKGTHNNSKYDIHIQNSKFRLNLTEQDFCKMACCILYARENLEHYKKR